MVKKILFFSLSLLTLQSFCMKNELKEKVKNTKKITVYFLSTKDSEGVFIDDNTTVLDIKNKLRKEMVVEQLRLYPLFRSWKQLGFDCTGEQLTDDQNIKQVMNKNSARFLLINSSDLQTRNK